MNDRFFTYALYYYYYFFIIIDIIAISLAIDNMHSFDMACDLSHQVCYESVLVVPDVC